jgi:mono/diheme cytochrome c family protein
MSRPVKVIGVIFGVLVGIIVIGVGAIYALSSSRIAKTHPLPQVSVTVPASDEAVARGRHLVEAVGSCMECHGEDLGGKVMMEGGPGYLVATNLTPGAGGIGPSYRDEDWVYAIRHGLRRDGKSLLMMPSEAYTHFTDEDLGAIVAYLKQLGPVDRELPRSEMKMLGRALLVAGVMPLLTAENTPDMTQRTAPPAGPTVEYGHYLAEVAGCTGCHGPELVGGIIAGPPGSPPSANLTPAALGSWTEADFFRAIREGKRPDGRELDPSMPWRYNARMTDDELRAIWLYLQTVPPKETPATD